MLREVALGEEGRYSRTINYFLDKVAKFSITGKQHVGGFFGPKDECAGRHTSWQTQAR